MISFKYFNFMATLSGTTIYFVLLVLFIIPVLSSAQESKNSLNFGIHTAYFSNIEESDFNRTRGYKHIPFKPGLELTFSRKIGKDLYAESGLSLSTARTSSFVNDAKYKFDFSELSIPLTIKKIVSNSNHKKFSFTGGLYAGLIYSYNVYRFKSLSDWTIVKKSDLKGIPYHSDDVVYADIYFDAGYIITISKKLDLTLSPFVKYRFNKTWLNHHVKNTQFGININTSLKF